MQQVASSRRIFPGGMRRLGSACREEHRELLQLQAYAAGSGLPALVEMCSGVFVKRLFLQLIGRRPHAATPHDRKKPELASGCKTLAKTKNAYVDGRPPQRRRRDATETTRKYITRAACSSNARPAP